MKRLHSEQAIETIDGRSEHLIRQGLNFLLIAHARGIPTPACQNTPLRCAGTNHENDQSSWVKDETGILTFTVGRNLYFLHKR